MTITAEERAWWLAHPELADVPRLLDALEVSELHLVGATQCHDVHEREAKVFRAQRDTLAAENARLRAALKTLGRTHHGSGGYLHDGSSFLLGDAHDSIPLCEERECVAARVALAAPAAQGGE